MKIVFASNNKGKIREIETILKSFPLELIPQSDLNVNEIKETGLTFVENALLKARHASLLTGLPAIADDSGLIVDVLNGAPGLFSARYAGDNATDSQNIQKLLAALKDTPEEKRTAAYHCTLVYLMHANDPAPLICEGNWYGHILTNPVGENGFGYDPIFYIPSENCSAAQLPLEIKNRMSHRSQALNNLLKKLPGKICLHSQ